MTPTPPHRLSPETSARAMGATRAAPWIARLLCGAFLGVILLVPLVEQLAPYSGKDRSGRPAYPRVLDGIGILPTPGEVWEALRSEGLVYGIAALNRRALEEIQTYEDALEEESILARTLIPPVRQVLMGRLGAATESVYAGRDGWLFFRPGVDYLTGPAFLSPEVLSWRGSSGTEIIASPQPDPVKAIVEFHEALSARGIALVVLPAPDKASVYPERLSGRFDGEQVIQNPSWGALQEQLGRAGVLLCDVAPALAAAKHRGANSLYLPSDTHWTPAGVLVVAETLAEFLRAHGLAPQGHSETYTRSLKTVSGVGDLAATLEVPGAQRAIPSDTVILQEVRDSEGGLWTSSVVAEILLLGDSYSNIYTSAAMNWGAHGGLPAQLSTTLQAPVDMILQNDGGAHATRAALSRELHQGRDRLAGKRVVVWQFAARELALGDWKTNIPIPAASPAALSTLPSPAERAAAIARQQGHLRAVREQFGGYTAWRTALLPFVEGVKSRIAEHRQANGGADVMVMGEGFLFSAGRSSYLLNQHDPLALDPAVESLAQLARDLEGRGILSLVLPIPSNEVLYPELFTGTSPPAPVAPLRVEFMERLLDRGVEVIDVLPAFDAAKSDGALISRQNDPHWDTPAIRLAAELIAERLKELGLGGHEAYTVRPLLLSAEAGALVQHLSEADRAAYVNPDITVEQVLDADGQVLQPPAHSPVCILGDSFVGMYSAYGGGLAAHVSHVLGAPVGEFYSSGGGPALAQTLARQPASFFEGRRVMVFCFVDRYLDKSRAQHWQTAPLPALAEFQPRDAVHAGATSDTAAVLEMRARLTRKTPAPTPEEIAPYTENLTVFAYSVEQVLRGTYVPPIVYVAHWGVLDGAAVSWTRDVEPGVEVILNLEELAEHPELQSTNISDSVIENYSLPLYFDAGAVALDPVRGP